MLLLFLSLLGSDHEKALRCDQVTWHLAAQKEEHSASQEHQQLHTLFVVGKLLDFTSDDVWSPWSYWSKTDCDVRAEPPAAENFITQMIHFVFVWQHEEWTSLISDAVRMSGVSSSSIKFLKMLSYHDSWYVNVKKKLYLLRATRSAYRTCLT